MWSVPNVVLVLTALISQQLSCCCLPSLCVSTRAPLFTPESRCRVPIPGASSSFTWDLRGWQRHQPELWDICEPELMYIDQPHCFRMDLAGPTVKKVFANSDYRLK